MSTDAVRPAIPTSTPATAFRARERVRWEDIDLAGIMRYSAYTRFHDVVEAEMLRAAEITAVQAVERLGVWLPRRALHVEYFAPVRFDEELEARLWVSALGRTSLTLSGELWSADGATRHAAWYVVLVCVDAATGEKREVPAELREALGRFVA